MVLLAGAVMGAGAQALVDTQVLEVLAATLTAVVEVALVVVAVVVAEPVALPVLTTILTYALAGAVWAYTVKERLAVAELAVR